MTTGMQSHQPPPEKKGRMLPPEGVRVGKDTGLFHLGGDRFVTARIWPEHQVGAYIVYAHSKWSKVPVARFETREEAESHVAKCEAQDAVIREGFLAGLPCQD